MIDQSNKLGSQLASSREEINSIDGQILKLLNRRAEIALNVGAVKSGNDSALCDEARERQVLDRLCHESDGPLDEQAVRNIFQRVIDESLYLQQRSYQKRRARASTPVANIGGIKVGVLGEPGTFSEEAALALVGSRSEIHWRHNIDELFDSIGHRVTDHILIPLENGLVGPIHRSFDLLLASELKIISEIYLPISQTLIACPAATMDTIRTVESHPAALAQCEMFFGENPQLVRFEAADTASSVRRAVESGDPGRAAIGSRRAAEIYGGKVIRENVEDHTDNWTRFVLLATEAAAAERGNKVSLVLQLSHKAGSLHNALRTFVRRGINLLKIESRPVKGVPSQFSFYLELEVPTTESEFTAALAEVGEQAKGLRSLGRYSTLDLNKVEEG
jgi:chorismate mutase/prephenate dehydratase